MNAFLAHLEKVSAASNPAEYLSAQRECLSVGSADEALEAARFAAPGSARSCDCFQIAYWLTPPDGRVDRFRRLLEEADAAHGELLRALLFRAVTEKTVRESHPERLERYLASVQQAYAKSLFAT